MRKYTNLILLTVLIAATLSCRKEPANQGDGTFNELLQQSMKTIRMIESFESQLNGNYKSGQFVEIDSAVWYAEAMQNLAYAHPEIAFNDFVRTKTPYTLTIDQYQMVTMVDFDAMYEDMDADLLAELEQIPSEEKNLRFADVRLDSIVGSTAFISVVRAYGFKFIYGWYNPFDEDDDWLWGTLGQDDFNTPPSGKCDSTEQGVSDGSDELERRLNNPVIEFEQPFRFVPTSIGDPIEFHGLDVFFDRLYAGWNYPEHNCLTNDTLTYYLEESHKILHDLSEGVKPEGKHLYDVQIKDHLILVNYQGQYYHHYYATYGILTLVPIID